MFDGWVEGVNDDGSRARGGGVDMSSGAGTVN